METTTYPSRDRRQPHSSHPRSVTGGIGSGPQTHPTGPTHHATIVARNNELDNDDNEIILCQPGDNFIVHYKCSMTLGKGHMRAPTDDLAREDVARKLLNRILRATGKEVLDYNYYKVAKLEERMRSLEVQNDEIKMENGYLKEQLGVLNYIDHNM
ncbi:hypothetical protein SESBI_12812 [Sesbania bispinosa]|nr:hypothetical protein SESBI_12812 [Sesbania bispinosa]